MEPLSTCVAERLGIGQKRAWSAITLLSYGRMTGWGQEGPLADAAGHDINYLSLTGACTLSVHRPSPSSRSTSSEISAVWHAAGVRHGLWPSRGERSGVGQVVDAAMVDGVALLFSATYGCMPAARGSTGVRPTCSMGALLSTACTKPATGSLFPWRHRAAVLFAPVGKLGLTPEDLPIRWTGRPGLSSRAGLRRSSERKTRDEWCALMEGSDVCFAPVLSIAEAPHHRHAQVRQAYVEVAGVRQPAPAPRFSRTPGRPRPAPSSPGVDTDQVLKASELVRRTGPHSEWRR